MFVCPNLLYFLPVWKSGRDSTEFKLTLIAVPDFYWLYIVGTPANVLCCIGQFHQLLLILTDISHVMLKEKTHLSKEAKI